MPCKGYPFVENDIVKEYCLVRGYPSRIWVASNEAKITLCFFYKGVDPTGHFLL